MEFTEIKEFFNSTKNGIDIIDDAVSLFTTAQTKFEQGIELSEQEINNLTNQIDDLHIQQDLIKRKAAYGKAVNKNITKLLTGDQ